MSVFNNDYRSGYDEIKSYYPIIYSGVKEMDANLKFAGWLADLQASGLERLVLNQFVATMEEKMITRLEAFLKLTVNTSRPLEERRKMVAASLVGFGKISGSRIKEIVKTFANDMVDVNFTNIITIKITRKDASMLYMTDLESVLNKRLPAHIAKQIIIELYVPISVKHSTQSWNYDFPLTGTIPYTATLGMALTHGVWADDGLSSTSFDYIPCGTILSGEEAL